MASAYLDIGQYKGIPLAITKSNSDTAASEGKDVYRVRQGVSLLKAASARGHGPSQLRLGFLYDPNIEASSQFDGGIEKDSSLAYRCYCAASHAAPVDVVLGENGEYMWINKHGQENGGPGSVAAQAHNQLGVMYMQSQVPSDKRTQQTQQQAEIVVDAKTSDRLGVLHFLVAAIEPLGGSTDAKANLRTLLQRDEDRSLVLEQASFMWGSWQENGNSDKKAVSGKVDSGDNRDSNSERPQEANPHIMVRLKQLLDS